MQSDLRYAAGHPYRLSGNGPYIVGAEGGGDDITWTNANEWVFVLRHFDVVAQHESADDSFLVSSVSAFGAIPLLGGGVGSGHVGSFAQAWDGWFCIAPGEGLRLQSSSTAFTVWTLLAGGWYEANQVLGTFSPP